MADSSTVARPYAKAIFEMARDSKTLQKWDVALKLLAIVSQDAGVVSFVNNPSVSTKQRIDLFDSIVSTFKNMPEHIELVNFIGVLAENHRLLVLSDIYFQYAERRAMHDKTIEVHVTTYAPFTKEQEEKLIVRLSARLNRQVTLSVEIDESLKGGAIIRAGHLVFDASVGTQINKLAAILAA
jgi:F-type H+-transporting ATPase subunit delta